MKNLGKISLVFLAAIMLNACSAKDDGASEALAATEAKLAEAETKLAALMTQHVSMMAHDKQIAVVNAWIEAWGSADVDKLDELAASDYKRKAPDLNTDSLDELKAFMLQVHEAYPDYAITNDGIVAGPDGVFVQWTVTGSDTGRDEGATGNSLRVSGISRYWFAEGKIAKELVIFDSGAVLTQLETDEMPHASE
jgi:predicted ester cyclase